MIVDAFNIERTIAGALYVIVKTLRRFICSSTGETAVLVPAPLFWFWRKFPSSAGHKSTVENLSPPRRVPRPCCGDAHLNNSYIMFEWLGIFSNQIGNGIISRMWLRTIPLSDDVKRWLQLSSHRQVENSVYETNIAPLLPGIGARQWAGCLVPHFRRFETVKFLPAIVG